MTPRLLAALLALLLAPGPLTQPASASVPAGYTYYSSIGMCVRLHATDRTFGEATGDCSGAGGELFMINDEASYNLAVGLGESTWCFSSVFVP